LRKISPTGSWSIVGCTKVKKSSPGEIESNKVGLRVIQHWYQTNSLDIIIILYIMCLLKVVLLTSWGSVIMYCQSWSSLLVLNIAAGHRYYWAIDDLIIRTGVFATTTIENYQNKIRSPRPSIYIIQLYTKNGRCSTPS